MTINPSEDLLEFQRSQILNPWIQIRLTTAPVFYFTKTRRFLDDSLGSKLRPQRYGGPNSALNSTPRVSLGPGRPLAAI